MPDQKTMRTRCLGGFFVMWVTKLLISPVKKKDFLPKIGTFVHFGLAHLVSCWWIGWWLWRAGCISQDTYLLYDTINIDWKLSIHFVIHLREGFTKKSLDKIQKTSNFFS